MTVMTFVAAYAPFTTSLRTPAEIAHGWNWAPNTYRCDQGWNDTAGHSYGCRAPGTRGVKGEWLCEFHAQRAEAQIPDYSVIAGCPECRADAGLPQRKQAPAQWYFCPTCDTEWAEDTMPSNWRPADAILGTAYLASLLTSLVFVAYLWMRDVVSHASYDPAGHLNFQPHDLATLGVALVCWLISVILIANIANAITGVVAQIVHFVRGTESREA
ncbi:MAG TPA: hypothetical protein VE155_06320 [Pseudonocardiaceae bacterium]|nr:hypothetical protein [Pseudonocardiaceae bacterium]